jgi:flagellar biosynthetic protein FlhB
MSEEDKSQQTEEPSQKKLQRAFEEGNTFTSKEVISFITLLTFTLILYTCGKFLSRKLILILQPILIVSEIQNNLLGISKELFIQVSWIIILPCSLIMLTNILSIVLQRGVVFSTNIIQPKLERISIIKGFAKIFSLNSVVEMLKGIIKMLIVGIVIYYSIKQSFLTIININNINILGGINIFYNIFIKMLIAALCMMFLFAVLDFIYERYRYMSQMKMTKHEVKQEYKEQEGSPEIKSKLRSLRMYRMKQRMSTAIRDATVVITNPTHYAIALKYNINVADDIPKVVAKGVDEMALVIKNLAKEYKIPIYEDPPLARLLYAEVELDKQINYTHYKAVAAVISYIMKLKR